MLNFEYPAVIVIDAIIIQIGVHNTMFCGDQHIIRDEAGTAKRVLARPILYPEPAKVGELRDFVHQVTAYYLVIIPFTADLLILDTADPGLQVLQQPLVLSAALPVGPQLCLLL